MYLREMRIYVAKYRTLIKSKESWRKARKCIYIYIWNDGKRKEAGIFLKQDGIRNMYMQKITAKNYSS